VAGVLSRRINRGEHFGLELPSISDE